MNMKPSNLNTEKTEKKKGTAREYAESFIVALAIALVIRSGEFRHACS